MALKPKEKDSGEAAALQAVEDALSIDFDGVNPNSAAKSAGVGGNDKSMQAKSSQDLPGRPSNQPTGQSNRSLQAGKGANAKPELDAGEINLEELEKKLTNVANDFSDFKPTPLTSKLDDNAFDVEINGALNALLPEALELENQSAKKAPTKPKREYFLTQANSSDKALTGENTFKKGFSQQDALRANKYPGTKIASAGVIAEDRRSAHVREIPADLAGTAEPIPAANDDRENTIADLVFALQRKPAPSLGWISAGLGFLWVAACIFYGFSNLGPELSGINSLSSIFSSPKILMLVNSPMTC